MTDSDIIRTDRSNHTLAVAGSPADGHGIITGFRGRDSMLRAQLVMLADKATLPREWLPMPKDPKVQLSRAVAAVASEQGLAARQEKRRNRQVSEEREPTSRWFLVNEGGSSTVNGDADRARAGDAYGRIEAVVTLYTDRDQPELDFDTGNPGIATRIQREFDERCGQELYEAADVTRWLNQVHQLHLSAVRYGFGWYVPRATRAIAEAIVDTFWGEAKWGEAWCSPPLPVATTAQLQMGIAGGLCREVDEIMADLDGQRKKAREAKPDAHPPADIGARAAENFMMRFTRVLARVVSYSELMGDQLVADVRGQVHDAMIELDGVLEGGVDATTFATVWSQATVEAGRERY